MPTLVECIDTARDIINEPVQVSLTARTFPDNTSSFFTDRTLMRFFNLIQQEAQQEIMQVYEDYFITQTTVNVINGQANYNLPTGFLKMVRVEDARNSSSAPEIPPVTINDKEITYAHLGTTAVVWGTSYYLRGTEIVFDQTPTFTTNSAVRLHFIRRLTDVTAGTSTSDIPEEHHKVIIWGIVKLALFSQQTPADLATQEYEKGLRKLREYAEQRQIQRSRQVKLKKREVF